MRKERERLDVDVLFVGAGPASLSGALHLANLINSHNSGSRGRRLDVTIAIIEKGREVGAHTLSGAVLDPRALRELVADYEARRAPLRASVREDHVWFLTRRHRVALPIIPPPLRNHGNYVISLGEFVKWLAGEAEAAGIDIFPEFPGVELLFDGNRVIGVRTGDRGVNKRGEAKPNFEPGVDIMAKVVILGEGVRGSLTKGVMTKFNLDAGRNPQVYSVGIKELWEVPSGRVQAGAVIHTMGYPLDSNTFGGGFIYALSETTLSVGFVIGLSYRDPRLDPHREFQRFKAHPDIRPLLEGGELLRYGAKALPEGGYYSVPQLYLDGLLIVGDAAGFLNSQRLKGIHLAMKSGMLAAETILGALSADDFSAQQLRRYETLVGESWIARELFRVRNFHQSFHRGLWFGLANAALQLVTNGRGLLDPMPVEPGHSRMKHLGDIGEAGSDFAFDGEVTFDKLTDVYYSRTSHEEDQPCHLLVSDFDICHSRCAVEYGNPCQHFCPASVYEMVETGEGSSRLQINAANCVHCKTCDIMDPYQIITWIPPEGGGGPDWLNM